MADERSDLREPVYRPTWTWTELFRAFPLAFDLSKIILATLAVVVLWFWWWLLGAVLGVADNPYGTWPAHGNRGQNPFLAVRDLGHSEFFTWAFWFGGKDRLPPVQMEPLHNFIGPVLRLLSNSPWNRDWWFALFGLLGTVAVWAIFAGAITRIAAVQIARREKIGMMEALRFSIAKFNAYVAAPLIPFIGIVIIALCACIGGLINVVPYAGIMVIGFFLPLVILAGAVIALLSLGYIGWPLMYATISTEGSDSFDALSRCYAYVYQRPWHFAFYALVSLAFGMVCMFGFMFLASYAVYLAKWSLTLLTSFSWQDNPDSIASMFIYAPEAYEWRRLLTESHPFLKEGKSLSDVYAAMNFGQVFAAGLAAFWLHLIFLFVIGFAYSFFWCSGTLIYFILRKKVDDTDLDEVYLAEEDDGFMAPPPPTETTATIPMAPPPAAPAPPPPASPPAEAKNEPPKIEAPSLPIPELPPLDPPAAGDEKK